MIKDEYKIDGDSCLSDREKEIVVELKDMVIIYCDFMSFYYFDLTFSTL